MLVLKLEIHPNGDSSRKRTIGEALIYNDGGNEDVADYQIAVSREGGFPDFSAMQKDQIEREGRIQGFDRARGAWALVGEALSLLFPRAKSRRKHAGGLALSRAETLELIHGKLHLIHSSVEEVQGQERLEPKWFKATMAKIALEAKRSFELIEKYEACETGGVCIHCGKPWREHNDVVAPSLSRAPGEPYCGHVRRLFKSMELETYQELAASAVKVTSWRGGDDA